MAVKPVPEGAPLPAALAQAPAPAVGTPSRAEPAERRADGSPDGDAAEGTGAIPLPAEEAGTEGLEQPLQLRLRRSRKKSFNHYSEIRETAAEVLETVRARLRVHGGEQLRERAVRHVGVDSLA